MSKSDGVPGVQRVDKWLWAVRLYKTRSAAKKACIDGRISINDDAAKPASRIKVGDLITARKRDRTICYEVAELIDKRVSASIAAKCYIDRSEPYSRAVRQLPPPGGARLPGEGRPTKKERRKLDRLRGVDR